MIYGTNIFYRVLKLYGRNSDIFIAMTKGEKISSMVKASYNKRGQQRINNLKKKIILFKDCKKVEETKFEANVEVKQDELKENLI